MNWSAVIAGVAGLAIGGSAVAISGAGAGRAEIEGARAWLAGAITGMR